MWSMKRRQQAIIRAQRLSDPGELWRYRVLPGSTVPVVSRKMHGGQKAVSQDEEGEGGVTGMMWIVEDN